MGNTQSEVISFRELIEHNWTSKFMSTHFLFIARPRLTNLIHKCSESTLKATSRTPDGWCNAWFSTEELRHAARSRCTGWPFCHAYYYFFLSKRYTYRKKEEKYEDKHGLKAEDDCGIAQIRT